MLLHEGGQRCARDVFLFQFLIIVDGMQNHTGTKTDLNNERTDRWLSSVFVCGVWGKALDITWLVDS